MSQRTHIAQELKDLNSTLPGLVPQNVYSVPEGYFAELSDQVLNRIKAIQAGNVTDELSHLSPFLTTLNRKTPYSVPDGYFQELEESLLYTVENSQNPKEELETLSPLLGSLKKEMPFSVPVGYFDNLASEQVKPGAKVVSLGSRKWFRYASAAVVTGLIVTAGFLIKQSKVDVKKDPHAWVKKSVKKVSTEKIEEFIQLTDEEKTLKGSVVLNDKTEKKEDLKELLKDVPESEIQSLINDTEILDETEATDDEILMN